LGDWEIGRLGDWEIRGQTGVDPSVETEKMGTVYGLLLSTLQQKG